MKQWYRFKVGDNTLFLPPKWRDFDWFTAEKGVRAPMKDIADPA